MAKSRSVFTKTQTKMFDPKKICSGKKIKQKEPHKEGGRTLTKKKRGKKENNVQNY